ncbi:MAG: hypothetical protein Tsb0014_33850 [Pleurocapsa sp.]
MTAIEEFREKIKAGQMFEALTLAMSEAIELKITTWVASSEIDNGEESQPGYRLHTRINLVDGEVENEIGSEFLKNPAYSELKKMHLEQVQQGRETLLKNLASLQQMFHIVNDTFSQIPPELPQSSISSAESSDAPALSASDE